MSSAHIYKCSSCQHYTLEKICSQCNLETILPKPPKYSPEDKYGTYRRNIKKLGLNQKGLY